MAQTCKTACASVVKALMHVTRISSKILFDPILTGVLCEQFGVMRLSEQMAEMRAMCISQVLGTDMKKHFDITSRFQVSPCPCPCCLHPSCGPLCPPTCTLVAAIACHSQCDQGIVLYRGCLLLALRVCAVTEMLLTLPCLTCAAHPCLLPQPEPSVTLLAPTPACSSLLQLLCAPLCLCLLSQKAPIMWVTPTRNDGAAVTTGELCHRQRSRGLQPMMPPRRWHLLLAVAWTGME